MAEHPLQRSSYQSSAVSAAHGTAGLACLKSELLGDTTGDTGARSTCGIRPVAGLPRTTGWYRKPVRPRRLHFSIAIERRLLADPVLADDLRDRDPGLMLLQRQRGLYLGVPSPSSHLSSSWGMRDLSIVLEHVSGRTSIKAHNRRSSLSIWHRERAHVVR